jgi:hypothetical protein
VVRESPSLIAPSDPSITRRGGKKKRHGDPKSVTDTDVSRPPLKHARAMATFVLVNRHQHSECDATHAAWRGFQSPLRRQPPAAGCTWSHHRLWWEVEADNAAHALSMLPPFVAERTEAFRVTRLRLP